MQTFADALDRFDERTCPWGLPMGLRDLDELTGGMVQGQLWVVVGEPGQGRTTLLLHLAQRWSLVCRGRTFLACPREPVPWIVGRLLSNSARAGLAGVMTGRVSSLDLASARAELSVGGLVVSGSERIPGPQKIHHLLDQHRPAGLLIDDVDLLPDVDPGTVRSWARPEKFVCVTLPRHLVARGPQADADLDPAWARMADMVLEVRTMRLGEGPDDRLGEAELAVLKNRWGPLATVVTSYQPYYARLKDRRGV